MQLTGPLFLYLFFPLSLLLLPFCPARYRKLSLTLLSVLWYLLANLGSPFGMLQIVALILLVALIAYLPDGEYPHLRCTLGVLIPLLVLLTSRVLVEYTAGYPYPHGITFVALGAISLSIDRYRGDAPERDDPLAVIGYLLFFPTLTAGPILRYKQYLYMTEHVAPSFAGFARGARYYMLGLVKRIAGAAVLLRAIEDLLSYGTEFLSPISLLFLLLLAYLFFYFFITGTTDMAKGLMAIYGLNPPRGTALLCDITTPHRLFYGIFLSLERYLQDYVTAPITRRIWGVRGRALAACGVFVLTVLFYRTRPEMLLLALPVLCSALLCLDLPRWKRRLRVPALRMLCALACAFSLSVFALALLLEDPMDIFLLIRGAFSDAGSYSIYHVYSVVPDGPYILLVLVLLLVGAVLHRFTPSLLKRLPARAREVLVSVSTVALFAGFLATLFHLLPQFPTYANEAIRMLISVR